jgi:hypothetical protein
MADGPPETALNCEALIPKAKATEGERIRTSRIYVGESQLSFVAIVFSLFSPSQPDCCKLSQSTGSPSFAGCSAPISLGQVLVVVGYLAGPAVALAYGLRTHSSHSLSLRALGRRTRRLPEGLSISPLGAPSDAGAEERS